MKTIIIATYIGLMVAINIANARLFEPYFIYFDDVGNEISEPIYGGSFRVILAKDDKGVYWVQDFKQVDFIDRFNPAITPVYSIHEKSDLSDYSYQTKEHSVESSNRPLIYYHDQNSPAKYDPIALPSLNDDSLILYNALNQQILLKGQYQNGLRSGLWQAYGDDSQILLLVDYEQGIPKSWEWRDYDGSLISRELPILKPQKIELESDVYYFNQDGWMMARYPDQPYEVKRIVLANNKHGVLIQNYNDQDQPISDAYYLQCDDIAKAVKTQATECVLGAELLNKPQMKEAFLSNGNHAIGWRYLSAQQPSMTSMINFSPLDASGKMNGTSYLKESSDFRVIMIQNDYDHGTLQYQIVRDINTGDKLAEIQRLSDYPKYYYSAKYSDDEPYLSEYFYFSEDNQKILHGPQTTWTNYANQKNPIQSIKDYEYGKLNGRAYEFSSDGTFLTKEEYYQHDEPSGTWTQKFEKDVINNQSIWVQPGKFVIRYSYLNDGRVYEIPMLNGQRHGDFRVLDSEGNVLEVMHYEYGQEIK